MSKKVEKLATMKEMKRYKIIEDVIAKAITQKQASEILGLTARQVRNIKNRVIKEGAEGIVHKTRGKASNNRISEEIKICIVNLSKTKYEGFSPTFLTEKLTENENLNYSKETIRKILTEAGLWTPKKAKEKHRSRRDRRKNKGELIQLDGSIHDWFSTGEKCWLINFVDDATGDSFGRYTKAESTKAVMKCMKEYIEKFGCPMAIYVDKDSIYKTTRVQTIAEQLENEKILTQFTRVMNELGIEVICANSPQAKGRVERSFKTHQDRLVKENKLRGITNIEEGNKFLPQYFKQHNKKFSVKPQNEEDMHIKVPKNINLNKIFCIQSERSIAKDFTVRFESRIFQILEVQKYNVLTRNKVIIEKRLDESLHMKYKDIYLKYEDITDKQPEKQNKEIKIMTRKEVTNIPSLGHPWRRWNNKTNSLKRKF
jgi:transposase